MMNFSRTNVLPFTIGLLLTVQTFGFIYAQQVSSFTNSPASKSTYPYMEPNVEIAKGWWTDQTNVWTPIGWKDNYLRYTVLYNGALIIDPAAGLMGPRQHSKPFVGKDFMLTFHTAADGLPVPLPLSTVNVRSIDYGHGIQGWDEHHETPVLWTEFRIQEGLVVRAEVFAHQRGSSDVETGLEPLYAWVRLRVVHVDQVRAPEHYPIVVQMSRVYYQHNGEVYNMISNEPSFALMVNPDAAPYPTQLNAEWYEENGLAGIRVVEPDGRVRLAVPPTEPGRLKFWQVKDGIYALRAILKAEVGDYVDLVVPMLPEPQQQIEEELRLTYDGALTLSDWYWAKRPATAAKFELPEAYITEAIAQSLKFAPVIAELDYETNDYSYLTGAWGYDCLWATPTSMVSHMFTDQLGYHNLTKKYAEIFYKNQGTVKAPGDAYYMHPGYYGSPKTLTSIDWLADHGAILLQVSTSALLSNDKAFITHWEPSILKACEFIKDMCAVTDHDGVAGLLPPAVSTDEGIASQSVQNLAWNYKGLATAVRLLEREKHPRAEEFAAFARNFREIFIKAYRELAEKGDRWTDAEGRERYLPPTTLSSTPMPFHPFSDAFYLDGGPMILVWAGLMDAEDPIMTDIVDFFRKGPNQAYFTPIYNAIWRPSLQREMSTCEPCYSWNVFHSWQLGDRQHFLEGLYSLFVGALSQNTYISCEHRHGIQGNLFVIPLAFTMAKLAVVDDQVETGELHLLRLCPQAWLSKDRQSVIENLPTEYGPVNLIFGKSKDGDTLEVTFEGKWHGKAPKVVLHSVPDQEIKQVIVNGKRYNQGEKIRL